MGLGAIGNTILEGHRRLDVAAFVKSSYLSLQLIVFIHRLLCDLPPGIKGCGRTGSKTIFIFDDPERIGGAREIAYKITDSNPFNKKPGFNQITVFIKPLVISIG